MIRYIGFIPVPVKVEETPPAGMGGVWSFPLIRIFKKYEKDEGLINHELRHAKQTYTSAALGAMFATLLYLNNVPYWWTALWLGCFGHPLLYTYVAAYRLAAEVDAYQVQLHTYGVYNVPDWVVDALVTKYDLSYSREYIKSQFKL